MPLPYLALFAHSWGAQSPGARAVLLCALAAALERKKPALASQLESHGTMPVVAKTEVELSVRQLQIWSTWVQDQGQTLQVRHL